MKYLKNENVLEKIEPIYARMAQLSLARMVFHFGIIRIFKDVFKCMHIQQFHVELLFISFSILFFYVFD